MNTDILLAGVLFVGTTAYLLQRNLGHMLVWVVLTYLIGTELLKLSNLLSMVSGVAVIYLIAKITMSTWESFENEEKKEKKSDDHLELIGFLYYVDHNNYFQNILNISWFIY